MGLDGISVNQIRSPQENNSAELNSNINFKLPAANKVVDGLSNGQRIDPDKEKEHEHGSSFNKNSINTDDKTDEENTIESHEDVIKYDLSKSEKYILKVDESTDEILIIDRNTKDVLEKIDARKLSNFVGYLTNPQGSLINRKF